MYSNSVKVIPNDNNAILKKNLFIQKFLLVNFWMHKYYMEEIGLSEYIICSCNPSCTFDSSVNPIDAAQPDPLSYSSIQLPI